MSAFQEIIGSVSRQKEEVLSQESRDELKDAVLQLVSYHYDNTVAVSEVTDLLASSSHEIKGVLKSCISVDNNPETGSLHMLEDCVSAVLKLAKDMQSRNHNTDIKEKIIKQVLVIQEVVDRQAFNRPRLLNLLCNEMTLPVYLIWVLNKEAIMALNTYISFKNSSLDFAKAFANELFNSISLYNEESWFLEILTQLVQSSLSVQKNTDSLNVKKISKHILELLNQKILDELSLNGGIVKVLDLTKFCPVEMLKQYYQGLISLWLAHRPVLKVAEALKQQKDWIFSKLSPSLTQWYKQCLVTLEPLEVLEQIKFVMDSQEVNWQTVLSFLSTAVVCVPQFSDLVQDYIVSLLNEGLVSCNLENLVIAFLFARQGCYEGPHVFSSYPDWFQSVFSEASSTPAANRKTFACLMKFLTDMVPFESSSHLKAHIVRPPFVPLKCRELLTDYILLAKTRLADLKQPLDGALEEDQDIESRKKMNEQIEDDIQKAVVLYQSSKKIPSSIMEASIFRKPYYVGKFLPVLLKPRALPDIPDLRMKFIDALKQVDKIPSTLYTNYLKACKAESARLLEGVFLEEDMDLELSEEEQLQFCLDELLKVILDNPTNRVVEQCSLLREKLKMVLHIEENRVEMYTSEPATVLNVNAANISPLQIKVVDQLLEFLACACQRDIEMSTAVSWPQDLFSVLQEMAELHSAIFIRIWKLIMEQGRDLDNHHIRTLGFCLAHTDHMTSRETTVQVCQGFCPVLQGNFTHLVWQELPISTSSWKKFSFSLMLEYIDFVSSIRKADVFQFLLPNVFCDKFQFLHGFFKDLHPDDQVLCSFGQLNKEIKSAVSRTQLAFRDWVQFEMETTFPDDILSFADWTNGKFVVAVDAGWQKRGSGRSYNSLSGHCSMVGTQTGQIIHYAVRSKDCRVCSTAASRNELPKPHDCYQNWEGSAKAMEADMVTQMVKDVGEKGFKVEAIVGDEDSTTIGRLRANVNEKIEKISDKNHIRKLLGNSLYALKKQHPMLTVKVIKYLQRCFDYIIAQGKENPSQISSDLNALSKHPFGDHSSCSSRWCRFIGNPNCLYKSFPHGKPLANQCLQSSLEKVFSTYAGHSNKLSSLGSTQGNESFNHMVAAKAPKNIHFSSSGNLSYRVAACVAQKNSGHKYLVSVNRSLGLSPGFYTNRLAKLRDSQRIKQRAVANSHKFKRKRLAKKSMKQVHVHSTVFNSYLQEESSANGSIKDNNRKIIGELFTQLLQQEMSLKLYPSSECKDCTSKEVHKHTEETHLYFISVLQTLISYLMPGKRVASWLAEQIQDEMVRRESNLEKEFCIQAIFRIISWFPAFRLFADSPSAPSALDLPCQIINQNFTCLCRCGYFPAREAIYMLQGLSQLENAGDVDSVLLRCPLLSLSLVVHTQFTRNLIAEIYKKHTNPGLEAMLKITDWVERSRTTPAPMPGELDVNVSMRSAALLSLLHTRSLTSLMEIIRKQARSSENRQDRVFEGFAVLLVAELIEVKSQFYKEAEQALENLLLSKPELLSYLASNMGEWELMLPQNVLHQMPFTLIKFLSRRKNTSWQSSLTYLSSVLLLHKKVVRCMDQQVPSENLIQMNDWIDVIGFVKGCFNSATKAQLKNVTKELLSDCGADIVLMYKQAIAREQ